MDDREPHAAFAKLADETRVDILRAVAAAQREREPPAGPPSLSFSDLYDRVDVSNSSRFAYHLDQLTGTFLRKTEDGYTFTYAGDRVVRTILSGAYNESAAFDPVDVAGTCPDCGAERLEARPVATTVRIQCRDCGQGVGRYPLTPGLVADRGPSEIVEAVSDRLHSAIYSTVNGLCKECDGTLTGDVREVEMAPGNRRLYVATCEGCWSTYALPLSMWALAHPATTAFYWERGVDLRELSFWELVERVEDGRWYAERRPDDAGYRVTVREDGDELRLSIAPGPDLAVDAVTRVSVETAE